MQGVLRSASSANDGRSTKMNEEKPKVLVIMGPTGSGKSKLSIDLASYFPIEVINADSMQIYHGLDVLTNKVPLDEQKGVAHHLLGTVNPNIEFTAKQFRDSAIPLISDILSRNCLPVIVGGTNYYIQALVSPFLLDDTAEDIDEDNPSISPGDEQPCYPETKTGTNDSYRFLEAIDPVAAKRIHPNNHRKISQYLSLYARTGVQPSKILRGKAAEKRGLSRLETLFRWEMHYLDATESISSNSYEIWAEKVVQPATEIVRSFLSQGACLATIRGEVNDIGAKIVERDLWTQYICKACGDRVLRGAHEWEQHVQGRGHRKRISRLQKSQGLFSKEEQQQQDTG